jgi:hypothetical protein
MLLVTRRAGRLTFRTLAVGLLLLGAAGGGSLGDERDRRGTDGVASPEALAVEIAMLQRLADIHRADRSDRPAVGAVSERKSVMEHVGRAQQADVRPAEPPAVRPGPPPPASVPASCNEYSGNRAIGCALLLEYGFPLDQMSCLDSLWTRESGWNHLAENPSSGAYGIPQSLPGNKMAVYGDDWRTNPVTQIRWGLSYIDNRYGTPCSAWGFFQRNNWY